MKFSDADLIEKLNALPDDERANLLEFLSDSGAGQENQVNLANRLEASIELHRKFAPTTRH